MSNTTLKSGKSFPEIPFLRKLPALNYHDAQFVILTAKNAFGKCLLQVAFHIFLSTSPCIVYVLPIFTGTLFFYITSDIFCVLY